MYILKTLKLNGSVKEEDTFSKINFGGFQSIIVRGLAWQDLHSITKLLSATEIIKKVFEGFTPQIPSFEIDPQKRTNLITYLRNIK